MSNDHTSSTQPMPSQGDTPRHPVGERLKAMIDHRTAIGTRKYGEPLHTFNGRDATQDALEEALDLCQYMTQIIMEREATARLERAGDRVQKIQRDTLVSIESAVGLNVKGRAPADETVTKIRDLLRAHHVSVRDAMDVAIGRTPDNDQPKEL